MYLKHCRANTPRAVARELLRPAKARLEFENALRLRQLGIPTVEPLAWGGPELLPGDSYLVTREQAGAMPFPDLLEAPLSPTTRRQLAHSLGRFLASLHDAGVTHPDPHPGNLLVEDGATSAPRFVLMDLHAVRFGRPLDWPAARDNLILFNRFFHLRATRADRLRFWRAYLGSRSNLGTGSSVGCVEEALGRNAPAPQRPAPRAEVPMVRFAEPQRTLRSSRTLPAEWAKELERATAASNCRFWAARTARYTADNRESKRVRGPAATGYAVRDLPADVLAAWLADPDAPFRDPATAILKDSRSSTVGVLRLANGQHVVYKRFNLKQPFAALKNLFRPSPAMRSWLAGNGIRDRGLPTARPLAVFHRRRFGVPTVGYAVCDLVPDAIPLPEALERLDHIPPGQRRRAARAWADRLGRLARLLHDRQVSHRDFKASNILLCGTADAPDCWQPVLIDLVGVETGKPVPDRVRVRDLARLNASFLHSPRVTRTDRLRFLRAYRNWGLAGRGGWKGWWVRVAAGSAEKAARNARTGRPLA
ncbi:MAG: lipopolysaccharide kinase InaA family protein [Gemmataceae bacterium]